MYPNYGSLTYRSKSTTDVYRDSFIDDNPQSPLIFSTIDRKKNRRNKAPAPPKRSDSLSARDAVNLKPTRSYLTNDILQQFELGYESSTDIKKTSPTIKSNNFVKRLVATLERRQKESLCNADSEFIKKNFKPIVKNESSVRNTVPAAKEKKHQETKSTNNNREHQIYKAYNEEHIFERSLPAKLATLQERDDEDDCEEISFDTDNDIWNETESLTPIPIHNNNNNVEEAPRPHTRRTLKSIFTSLLSWRSSKSLPKGTRDYYATRESLGEEMRAFRRDTMPQLMKHAAIKSKLNLHSNEAEFEIKNEQRKFSKLIGSPKLIDDEQQKSIATIHSVYGSKANIAMQHRGSWYSDQEQTDDKEIVHGSMKVELPAIPLCTTSKQESSQEYSPPIEQNLLRPSKIKDLQKRLSRESVDSLQHHKQQYHTDEIIYDVPTSNRRVLTTISEPIENQHSYCDVELRIKQNNHYTPPVYKNLASTAIDDDKRLQCTKFTSF